jgi:hypothetical protein
MLQPLVGRVEMADVELLVSEPIRVEIEGGTAHIFLRSGGEDLRFAASLHHLLASIAIARRAIAQAEVLQAKPTPIRRGM